MRFDPKTFLGRLRIAMAVFACLGVAYLVYRFGIERIPSGYTCLEPEFRSGSRVISDRLYALSGALAAGDTIAFRLRDGGRDGKRYGRVVAAAGVRVEGGQDGLVLDGARSDFPAPAALELPAVVPRGELLVLTNFAVSTDESFDTRGTFLIAEVDVLARILVSLAGP